MHAFRCLWTERNSLCFKKIFFNPFYSVCSRLMGTRGGNGQPHPHGTNQGRAGAVLAMLACLLHYIPSRWRVLYALLELNNGVGEMAKWVRELAMQTWRPEFRCQNPHEKPWLCLPGTPALLGPETRGLPGLACCQLSYKISESCHLRGIRERMIEQDTDVLPWTLNLHV